MVKSNETEVFIQSVCDQIRWKKCHDYVSTELQNHIIDQREAFLEAGMNEIEATQNAVKEMGDPIEIGQAMDIVHRPKIHWPIVFLTSLVLLIGLISRWYISAEYDNPQKVIFSIFPILFGCGIIVLAYFIDFSIFAKHAIKMYIGLMVFILIINFVPSHFNLGYTVNGRMTHVQFLFLLFPVIYSGVIYQLRSKRTLGILVLSILMFLPLYLAIMIPTPTNLLQIGLICFILLNYAILKGWFGAKRTFGLFIGNIIPTSVILLLLHFIRQAHISTSTILLHVSRGMEANRKLVTQAPLIKLPLFSRNSASPPSADTTNLLTYLISHLGWIAFIFVMLLLLFLVIQLALLSTKQKNTLGKLVSFSILLTFSIQILIYVLYNLGLSPIYPETLPFISYSGVSSIINLSLIGLLLSVHKTGYLVAERPITCS